MSEDETGEVWWDGQWMAEGRVPLVDALRTGDGVFETLRTFDGEPFLLDAHLRRLLYGARTIGLQGLPTAGWLERHVRRLLRTRKIRERPCVLRLALLEGRSRAHVLVVLHALRTEGWKERRSGVRVGSSVLRHPGNEAGPGGARGPPKWLGRGALTFALRAARRRGWEEALLRDASGRFVEGTRSNLIISKGRRVIAPGPRSGALAGTTRTLALREARRVGRPVADRPILPQELFQADEVLLTSSLLGIVPVSEVDGRRVGPDSGELGELGRSLWEALRQASLRLEGAGEGPHPAQGRGSRPAARARDRTRTNVRGRGRPQRRERPR